MHKHLLRASVVSLAATAIIFSHQEKPSAQILTYDIPGWIQRAEQILKQTATLKEGTQTAKIITEMSEILDNLDGFQTTPVPPTTWDPTGPIAAGRINAEGDTDEMVAEMDEGEPKRNMKARLGLFFAGARTLSHGLKTNELLRKDSIEQMAPVFLALGKAIFSKNKADHKLSSILQKMAAASALHAHQFDAANQISGAIFGNMAVDQQRKINTETEHLNLTLTGTKQAVPFGESYISGSSDSIRNWRVQ